MIQLKVYKYNDPDDYLGILPVRLTPKFMEQLKANGAGSFKIPLTRANVNPELLEYRNIVKVEVDGTIVGGFLIGQKNTVMIDQGEYAGQAVEIIGEGLKVLADDAAVEPYGGLKATSGDTRSFNFSSEEGAWYNPSDWIAPFDLGLIHTKPNGAWGDSPTDWPKNSGARWIWGQPFNSQAQLGTHYFRLKHTIAAAGNYRIYAACDNFLSIWLDGVELAVSDPKNISSWHKGHSEDVYLEAGEHIFAFTGANAQHAGFNPGALVVAITQVVGESESVIAKSGTGNWKVLPIPAEPPGWTPGEVLLDLLNEAKVRGVLFADWFTPTFTATHDSNGVAWSKKLDITFDVGESYLSVVSKLEEMIGDIWFDCNTMQIHAAHDRGTDRTVTTYMPDGITIRSAPIKFEKGKNLRSAAEQGVGKIKNSLKVRTSEGWLTEDYEWDPSTQKYGRLEGKLQTDASNAFAKDLAQVVFAQRATPEEGATYSIAVTDGKKPWVDYFVGDWVLAPNSKGILVPRRIMSIAVEETETGTPVYTLEFDTIFKTNEQKLAQFMGKSTGGGSVSSGLSNGSTTPPPGSGPVVIPSAPAPILYPKNPTSVQVTSVGAWSSDGVYPESKVTVDWTPVTLNTDESPTVPEYYEVWGYPSDSNGRSDRLLATTLTDIAEIPGLTPGIEWKFRVRALNSPNAAGEFSAEVTHTTAGPTTPMNPPSAPTVSSEMGLLIINWDGILTGPMNPPPQFRYVYALVLYDGTLRRMGGVLQRGGGTISVPGIPVGTEVLVALVAVDGVGIESDPSAGAATTIVGVDVGDLDEQISDAIDAAHKAAIDARQNVNLVEDPSFELGDQTYWDWNETGVSNVTVSPRTGLRHLRVVPLGASYEAFRYKNPLPCDPGDSYLTRIYVKVADTGVSDQVDNAVVLTFAYSATADGPFDQVAYGNASQVLSTDQYTVITMKWTIPEGVNFFKPAVFMADVGTDNVYYIDDVRVLQMVGEMLIVDGAVVADKIAAEAISATHIQAAVIDTVHLRAEAVTAEKIATDAILANHITAGAIEANHVAAGAIQTNHLSPVVGEELDISANDTVTIIAGQIDSVSGDVNDLGGNVEEMQTYYSFGPTGAVISTPDSPFATAIRNDRIEMLENGNVVSYWNSGTMYVNQMVGEKVILGNHQLEKYSDGTVVRAL